MALTLDTFAEVLKPINVGEIDVNGLIYILEGGATDGISATRLRAMADFLVAIDEYVDGAADLAEELAELASEAGAKRIRGGTSVAKPKDKDRRLFDDEDEGDEEEEDADDELTNDLEEEDDDEEEPMPKARKTTTKAKAVKKPAAKKAKKAAAPKKTAKKKVKARSSNSHRNAPVPEEERVPFVAAALKNMKDGGTINELFVALSRTAAGEKLFPTRRAVKRVLTHREGDDFKRSTPTIWHNTSRAAKAPKAKAKAKVKAKAK